MTENELEKLTVLQVYSLARNGSQAAKNFIAKWEQREREMWEPIKARLKMATTFLEGDKNEVELKEKYSLPEFEIFMEGARWMFVKVDPYLHRGGLPHARKAVSHSMSKKHYRKQISKEDLQRAMKETLSGSGKINFEAIARKVKLKDGKSVKVRMKDFGLL